jgi:hypothetical protein
MSLVNTLKKTLSISSNKELDQSGMAFVKSRKTVVSELTSARESGALIGVYSKSLGEGMFLVGVNDVELDRGAEVVVFETYEQTGAILNRTRLSIDEIKMVCPLNMRYLNPILNRIQFS